MNKRIFLAALLFLLFRLHATATVVYVDSAHTGGIQDGLSWATAFSNFQSGINAANAGDSVWVAKGTYLPLIDTSFTMKDSVMIFGGFLNTNTAFEQRDVQNNVTILKGNGSRVITNISSVPTMMHLTCISGFTIKEGHTTGFPPGGGMYNLRASPAITDCIFMNNSSISGGGGLDNSYCTSLISNCAFYNNTGIGGAIRNNACSLVIINCKFLNNHAEPNNLSGLNSGAIADGGTTNRIMNCYFQGNIAKYGGCLIPSTDTITNCVFVDNVATEDGGVITTAGQLHTFVKDCTFLNNSAKRGGAIYFYVDTFTVVNCKFSGNKAERGGAIYSFVSNVVKISNCTFIKDTALIEGGAIYIRTNGSSITNCLFSENVAGTLGSAMYITPYFVIQAMLPITNCTFVNNISTGNGATLFTDAGGNIGISNSIVWNNTGGGLAAANTTTASVSVTYSLVQGEPASVVNHNLDGNTNPLFANMAGGDYRLPFNSPCVDKGNNDTIPTDITTDIAGNSRIWNNTVDMGVYEYAFALDLGNDTTICSGNPVTLDAQNVGSAYLWNNGSTTQTITVNTEGTYSVVVTNILGSITDTINITVNPSPIVFLGNDTILNEGSTIILDAGNPGSTYLWNTGETTRTISASVNGAYIVTVFNNKGCFGSDTIILNFKPLSIGNVNTRTNAVTVSPNPTKSTIHINITDNKLLHTKAILTDAYGRIVRTVMMENNTQLLSLADLSSGIYILKMENGAAAKIVKE